MANKLFSKNGKINEKNFYNIWDIIEDLPKDSLDNYFPTVKELEEHEIEKNLNKYMPILLFLLSDPYKDIPFSEEEQIEYEKTKKYAEKIYKSLNI